MIPINKQPDLYGPWMVKGYNEVRKGRVTHSELIKTLEEEITDYLGVKHCITTGSGTTALFIAMETLRKINCFGRCNAVIDIPAFTLPNIDYVCETAGLEPNFVDVDPHSWHIKDIQTFAEVRMLMDAFGNVAKPHKNISFNNTIIDASHSFGAPDDRLRGIAHIYSLNGGKIFTSGEGGIITTNDEEFAALCKKSAFIWSRMSTLQAAVGLESLFNIEQQIESRYENYLMYLTMLNGDYVRQHIPISTNYYMFVCTHMFASDVAKILRDEYKIDVRRYYTDFRHLKPGYDGTRKLGREHLCLPTYKDIPIDYIIGAMNTVSDEVIENALY